MIFLSTVLILCCTWYFLKFLAHFSRKIHDATGAWHLSLMAVAIIALVMAVFGGLAGRDREINVE